MPHAPGPVPRRATRHSALWLLGSGVVAAIAIASLVAWQVLSPDGGAFQPASVAKAEVSSGAVTQVESEPPAAGSRGPSSGSSSTASGDTNFGLTREQWQELQARVEPGPAHDGEVARIVSLLAFQQTVDRWRALRDDPAAVDERRRLAHEIDAGIGPHLALHETTGNEAMLLKAAVLSELQPDPLQREAALQAWRASWLQAHPPEAPDPRVDDYHRQEAALVAQWQAQPAPQRDPADLARRLQSLQVAVFDH